MENSASLGKTKLHRILELSKFVCQNGTPSRFCEHGWFTHLQGSNGLENSYIKFFYIQRLTYHITLCSKRIGIHSNILMFSNNSFVQETKKVILKWDDIHYSRVASSNKEIHKCWNFGLFFTWNKFIVVVLRHFVVAFHLWHPIDERDFPYELQYWLDSQRESATTASPSWLRCQ